MEVIKATKANELKIYGLDSVMGSGKSTYAINYINDNPDVNFIIVLPTLSEIDRYKEDLDRDVYIPNEDKDAVNLSSGFTGAVSEKHTILTTHALLERWDTHTTNLISKGNYVLILDEVVDVVHSIGVSSHDFDMLLNNGYVFIHEEHGLKQIIANSDKNYSGQHSPFLEQVKNNSVYLGFKDNEEPDDGDNINFCIWLTPPEKLSAFKAVWILTYLFDGSEMAGWLKLFDMHYSLYSVENGEICKHSLGNPERFKSLIHIHDDRKRNIIGSHHYSLSSSWFKTAKNVKIKDMKNKTRSYFKDHLKSNAYDNAFTVFKDYKKQIAMPPFSMTRRISAKELNSLSAKEKAQIECFISNNSKGTNNFKHKKHLAYLINKFAYPSIIKFFKSINYEFDENRYALSELIQWIWRSQIREGKPITLYIPSKRMRAILWFWLSGKDVSEMTKVDFDSADKEIREYNKLGQIELKAVA